MKMRYALIAATLLLLGAGCTAKTDVTGPSNGLRVNGSVDVTGDDSGGVNNY